MDARKERGKVIAETCKLTKLGSEWFVPASSGNARYIVNPDPDLPTCTCPDYELRGMKCKHIFAVLYTVERERNADGTTTVTERVTVSATVEKKTTYPQNWTAYNAAQTTEKGWFLSLLADLCRSIPDPPRKPTRGQQPVCLADAVFACCYKVYSGFSGRRFATDLEAAVAAGHAGTALHFNTVLKTLDTPDVTPILTDLIARSASPLRAVETDFAVDSSGFSGCRFDRWLDEKYGTPKKEAAWVKAHVVCGAKTNVIAAAVVLDKDTGDAPQLPPLVNAAAGAGFTIGEVSADKAYGSLANYEAVERVGGTLYAAFKANATGAAGGAYGKMYHYFALHREDFLTHYHKRSNVESTFSMVKRKFGDSVRAKSDLAMKNEVLAKFVCHNLCCVVAAIYERGIDPTFAGLPRNDLHIIDPGCTP